MKNENIQKVENENAVLTVKIYPKENSETVILLHGGPGVPDEMVEVVEILQEKYQVINFEQRGVGDSICTNCDYSMGEYISDIDAIAEHFSLKSFHIFGHSWGGLYAQIYAKKRPEKIKSLFLASPASGTNIDFKKVQKEVMQYNKSKVSDWGWAKMGLSSALGMFGSDKAYQSLFKQAAKNYNKGYNEEALPDEIAQKIHAESINKTTKEISKYPLLEKVENPNFSVIVTYGDSDIYGESKKLVYERYPTAKFFEIKNAGHMPKHNLSEFRKIMIEFYYL